MPEQSQIANRKSQIIAWQGWSLRVPATWNPVKIEGDYDQGSMLLADLSSARLGIRWRTAGRGDPAKWADRALRDELGNSADHACAFAGESADTWKIARIYLADEVAARDVFVAWSTRSNRVVELVYNVAERDDVLEQEIAPTLADTSIDTSHRWSIFGLDFTVPADLKLQSFALNAGDLSLTFRTGRHQTTIRRISPASLALTRQPLARWFTLNKSNRKIYRPPTSFLSLPLRGRLGGGGERHIAIERPSPPPAPTPPPPEGEGQEALTAIAPRRLRLSWAWFIPRKLYLRAAHDEANNCLLIGTSSDVDTLNSLFTQLTRDSSSIESPSESLALVGVA